MSFVYAFLKCLLFPNQCSLFAFLARLFFIPLVTLLVDELHCALILNDCSYCALFFFSLFRSLNSAWGLAKKWNFLFSTSPSEIKKRKERRLMVSCSFHLLVVLIAQFPQSFPPFLSSFIARFCHNFPSLSFFFFHCHFFFYFSLLFNAIKQVSLLCYAYSTPKHTWTWRNWGPPFCFCFRVFFSFPLTLFSVRLNGIFCVPILRLFSWCTFFSLFNQNDSSL